MINVEGKPLFIFKILEEYRDDKKEEYFRSQKKKFIKKLNPLFGRGKNTEKSRVKSRKYTESKLNVISLKRQEDLESLTSFQLFNLGIKKPCMDLVWKIYNDNFLRQPYVILDNINKKKILKVSEFFFERLYNMGVNPNIKYAVSNILYLSLPFLSEKKIFEICQSYLGKINTTSLTSKREGLKLFRAKRKKVYQQYNLLLEKDIPDAEERFEVIGKVFNVSINTIKNRI